MPGNLAARAWRLLVGRPLRLSEAQREQINPLEGLPALSLDALTSVAYGPEAIVVVLAAAGPGALGYMLPVTGAIVVLLAILVMSYRQVIDGFPGGGGAYAVSKANLSRGASQLAGAALIVDYTLTVAVSIAAGVASLTSAFPSLSGLTLVLCLAILALITLLNLRGLGESARAFFLPTAVFIVGLLAVIAIGLVHPLAPHLHQPGRSLLPEHVTAIVGPLLLLKAFSSGCSALTGVEAIANGVPLFRPPQAARAKQTELLLGALLTVMLLGLALLVAHFHVGPRSGQTVLSQVMGYSVGRNWAYYTVSMSVTVVLALAANTSFGGLPVLLSLLSEDNFVPHAFSLRGERLVYSNGVWSLAVLSGLLLVAVDGSTNALIPLFAIGVFTGFTLAQIGMVVHWRRARPRGWQRRAALNALGALMTGAATAVFVITKFTAGGWVVVVAVPALMSVFRWVERYYRRVADVIGLGRLPPSPAPSRMLVLVLVNNLSVLTSEVVSDALSVGDEVRAVTVSFADNDAPAKELKARWERWAPGVPLVVLRSQYPTVSRPVLSYLATKEVKSWPRVLVLIPVVRPKRWLKRLLHNQLDLVLTAALRRHPGVIVARLPLNVDV